MQVHLFISGIVQGVGFRFFVQEIAEELELTGWVKNLPDGKVEAVAQGEKVQLDKFIIACRKGPYLSEVEDVHDEWEEAREKFIDFEIR